MKIFEKSISIKKPSGTNIFEELDYKVKNSLQTGESLNRFVVSNSNDIEWQCEIGISHSSIENILSFSPREYNCQKTFNTAFILPTGVGCEIGGHAGDGAPISQLLASCCDTLITHPNAVNGADINELTENTMYVEGSTLSQLLMGQVSLSKTRANRLIVLIEEHEDKLFENSAINSVNAAVSCYGLTVSEIIIIPPLREMSAEFTNSGRASGKVSGMEEIMAQLKAKTGSYDAVAITSRIGLEDVSCAGYFSSFENDVNPWGGVESMLTHQMSLELNVPCAHSPMYHSQAEALFDPGIVDPRKAAEVISWSFLQCILKGLQRSPKILQNNLGDISARNISCLVQPNYCIGLPTLAALTQGIPVVAVENKNSMKNDLKNLPWQNGQLIMVTNYLEAAGVLQSLRSGIALESVQRPLSTAKLTRLSSSNSVKGLADNIL